MKYIITTLSIFLISKSYSQKVSIGDLYNFAMSSDIKRFSEYILSRNFDLAGIKDNRSIYTYLSPSGKIKSMIRFHWDDEPHSFSYIVEYYTDDVTEYLFWYGYLKNKIRFKQLSDLTTTESILDEYEILNLKTESTVGLTYASCSLTLDKTVEPESGTPYHLKFYAERSY